MYIGLFLKKKKKKKEKRKIVAAASKLRTCAVCKKNLGRLLKLQKYRKRTEVLRVELGYKRKREGQPQRGDFLERGELRERVTKNKQGEGTKRLAAGCFWAARKKGKESWVE